MTRGGDTPTPPAALFSVFTDAACTTRPIVGQSHDNLFVRVNRATAENEYYYGLSSSNDFQKLNVLWYVDGEAFDINLYVDFQGQFGTNPIPAGTVIEVESTGGEITIGEGAVFDFG